MENKTQTILDPMDIEKATRNACKANAEQYTGIN